MLGISSNRGAVSVVQSLSDKTWVCSNITSVISKGLWYRTSKGIYSVENAESTTRQKEAMQKGVCNQNARNKKSAQGDVRFKSEEKLWKDLLQAIWWTVGLCLNAVHFQLPCVQLCLIHIRQNENTEAPSLENLIIQPEIYILLCLLSSFLHGSSLSALFKLSKRLSDSTSVLQGTRAQTALASDQTIKQQLEGSTDPN